VVALLVELQVLPMEVVVEHKQQVGLAELRDGVLTTTEPLERSFRAETVTTKVAAVAVAGLVVVVVRTQQVAR
jgi:hypothetical protein